MSIQPFDFSVDLIRAILWQYNDAARLQSLLRSKDEWYVAEHQGFWTDWTRDVFDMTTANEFGLSVWGIILNIPLSLSIPGSGPRPVFGFGEHNRNYDNGTFGQDASGVAGLTVEEKRMVLRLRYYQLVTDGTVPHINYILREVFGHGYVIDRRDMTATYVFPVAFSSSMLAILREFDLLPRPAGVQVNIFVDPSNVFGFDPYYKNFDNGGFGA